MAASSSPDPVAPELQPFSAGLLLDIADAALLAALRRQPPAPIDVTALPPDLQQPAGVFVTLEVDGQLNGCIGTIDGQAPLALATARYAVAAAFDDPRLPPLRASQYDRLDIEVSVLSPLAPIDATSRARVLEQLRPRSDGLLIAGSGRRGVFLPAVWEQLPAPREFLRRLEAKAGWSPGDWPPDAAAFRFTAHKYARRAGHRARV